MEPLEALDRFLAEFMVRRRAALAEDHPELVPLGEEIAELLSAGGKRIRPAFVFWGCRAAGAEPDPRVVAAAASLELLHTFALIQDDLIDGSPVRRGRPASHVGLARLRPGAPSEEFGRAAALLASDLAFTWADDLLIESGLDADLLPAAYHVLQRMREDMLLGEHLDVLARHDDPSEGHEDAILRLYRYKTAAYTVQRPIELGLTLGRADEDLLGSVAPYAVPAGIAFQLRDDLIGAFGDPDRTGKPPDDLVRGKPTWLLARALRRAGPVGREEILSAVAAGDPAAEPVERLRALVRDTGAVEETEALIERLTSEALAATGRMPVPDDLREELAALTERAVRRDA